VSTKPLNQSVRLTKTVLDKLPVPMAGQSFLRDLDIKGFGARVTYQGTKTFILEKRVNGRVKRMTLGRVGELTCEQARKLAQRELGKIAMGLDPIAEKRRTRQQGISLREAFRDFLQTRKNLKARTRYDYERLMEQAFKDWMGKAMLTITKAMISKRHTELGERGEAYANQAMRMLRGIYNFAQAHYDDHHGLAVITENPVLVLTRTKNWYRVERRQTVIKPYQLPAWFQGIQHLRGNAHNSEIAETVADYLLFLLFTGLRRQEAGQLRWTQIDMEHRTLTITDTKNHEQHTLPLTPFLINMLKERKLSATNDYVFPGKRGIGYLIEPKKQIQKVIEHSGVHFIIHDLRRTFITIAESLDIPPYSIKRLVNHKMRNDVTAGYIVTDIERLRTPMQTITNFLAKALGIDKTPIIELQRLNQQ
jgi:integrase